MATNSRRKKSRLTHTTTLMPMQHKRKDSNNTRNDLEIKTERTDVDPDFGGDIKPDVDELNKELCTEKGNSIILAPPVLPPNLFIISPLLAANSFAASTNTAAAAALKMLATCDGDGSSLTPARVFATTSVPQLAPTSQSPQLAIDDAGRSSGNGANNARDVYAKDENDLQQSDTEEEGYSDLEFDDDGDEDELIEDDDDDDAYDPLWTDQPTTPRMVFNFDVSQQNVGLHGRPTSLDPGFYIAQMLGSETEFFGRIARSTNAKAQQQKQEQHKDNTNKGRRRIHSKDIISIEEIKAFVAICLQMSNMKLRTLAEYWNEPQLWGFTGFGSKLSFKRFQTIMNSLSFDQLLTNSQATAYGDSNGGGGSGGRLTADAAEQSAAHHEDVAFSGVQPLIDFFNARMEEIYTSGQRLVLNDPILFWKGKFSWFSDVSSKFRCNAILLHLLTEYTGLIQRLELDMERIERRANVRNSRLLVAQRVAVAQRLLSQKRKKGHTVYASKFYGSYALAYELAAEQTYCTGFLDVKRYGNCKELILNRLTEPKTFATKYAGSIMMGKWRNTRRNEYFLSSDCLAIYAQETSLRTFDRRPKIIKELNWQLRWKLSEDMKAKMLSYQLCLEHSELKWDKQLFIYLLNLLIYNAYILYIMHAQLGRTRFNELHLRDTTILKKYSTFRQEFIVSLLSGGDANETLAEEMSRQTIGDFKKKRRLNISTSENSEEDNNNNVSDDVLQQQKSMTIVEHFPTTIPQIKGKVMKKKCRFCHKGGLLTYSKLCCTDCPGMPGLCETPCFKLWHEKVNKSMETTDNLNVGRRILGRHGEETIYF